MDRGFTALDGDTAVTELAYHDLKAKLIIRYSIDLKNQRVLDLTNPNVAREWNFSIRSSGIFECQEIAKKALNEGYNVIKVHSYRGEGVNCIIFDNFDEILNPMFVIPIGE